MVLQWKIYPHKFFMVNENILINMKKFYIKVVYNNTNKTLLSGSFLHEGTITNHAILIRKIYAKHKHKK